MKISYEFSVMEAIKLIANEDYDSIPDNLKSKMLDNPCTIAIDGTGANFHDVADIALSVDDNAENLEDMDYVRIDLYKASGEDVGCIIADWEDTVRFSREDGKNLILVKTWRENNEHRDGNQQGGQ